MCIRDRITAYLSRHGHSKREGYALNTPAPPSGPLVTSGGGEIYPDEPTNFTMVNSGAQGFECSSLTLLTNQISEPSGFSEWFRSPNEPESTYDDLDIDEPTNLVVVNSGDQGVEFSSLTQSTNDGQLPGFSEWFRPLSVPEPTYGDLGAEDGLGVGYEMPVPGDLGYPEVVDNHVTETLVPFLPRQARVDKDETEALVHVVTNGRGYY